MANISLVSALVNGIQRQVNLSTNTIVVQAIQVNGTLLSSSTSGADGSRLVGDNGAYTNITQGLAGATVKGTLQGIDSALSSAANAANKTLSNLTSPTAVNQSLLTATGGTQVLGSATNYWGSSFIASITDSSSKLSADFFNRLLDDATATKSLDWNGRTLYFTNGTTAMLSWATAGSIDVKTNTIINLGTPVNPTDAATKAYADALAQGTSWKTIVRSATTAALPANTYSNGSSGVGATLTATANAALTAQDGVTLVAGDRLLVKNEATLANNGIYVVTQVGSGSLPYILTRSTDCDESAEFVGATVEIGVEAVTQGKELWFQSTPATITVGTSSISFIEISSGATYTFGNGLTVSSNVVSVLSATGSAIAVSGSGVSVTVLSTGGIQVTSSALALLLADTSLATSASGVQVNLATSSGLAVASGLKVNVDNVTLDVNGSNQVEVKASGISATQLSTSAFDQKTITGGGGTPASVAYSPALEKTAIIGEVFVANNTTYAMRWGLSANAVVASGVVTVSTTASSTAATLSASNSSIAVGQYIVSANIPAGTTVSAIAGTSLTLSAAATATASGTAIAFNEAADNLYVADDNTATFDLFHVVGVVNSGASGTTLTPGVTTYTFVARGDYTLASSDTAFAYTSVGDPLWLTTAGAFSTTAPSAAGTADVKIGVIHNTNKVWIDPQIMGVN